MDDGSTHDNVPSATEPTSGSSALSTRSAVSSAPPVKWILQLLAAILAIVVAAKTVVPYRQLAEAPHTEEANRLLVEDVRKEYESVQQVLRQLATTQQALTADITLKRAARENKSIQLNARKATLEAASHRVVALEDEVRKRRQALTNIRLATSTVVQQTQRLTSLRRSLYASGV